MSDAGRTEAAAEAICLHVAAECAALEAHRDAARRVLAAADAHDRGHGWLRIQPDAAQIAYLIENWNQPKHKQQVPTVGSDAYALAQDLIAALAAVGAQGEATDG